MDKFVIHIHLYLTSTETELTAFNNLKRLKSNGFKILITSPKLIPLYFYQSTKSMQQALDSSRTSSSAQINILQNTIDEQTEYYDKLFQEYQDRMDAEEIRYNEEIKNIKDKFEFPFQFPLIIILFGAAITERRFPLRAFFWR